MPNLMGKTHKILYLNFFLSHKGEIMLYELLKGNKIGARSDLVYGDKICKDF